MKEVRHFIEKRIWFSKWYKWISLLLLLLLLFCLFFKRCSNPSINQNSNNNNAGNLDNKNDNGFSDNRDVAPLPINRNRQRPIDPDKIESDPNDPLNRDFINDLVNVYLKDTVDIENFYYEAVKDMPNYTLVPTDTAEAYKRIQFMVNKNDRDEIILAFKSDSSRVKYATKEWVFKSLTVSIPFNDPEYSDDQNKWFYEKTGVFDAWEYTKGKPEIKIAVLDDGFDLKHKELKNKFITPWNVMNYSDYVNSNEQNQFHGTHVAGTIVAEANNNFGISGVAPDCTFIPVQIADNSGYITTSSVLDGIFYALKNKANIINLSIAFSLGSAAKHINKNEQLLIKNTQLKDEEKLWEEVFEIAEKSNTIIVQAAGNDAVLSGVDPMKRNKNCIVVGALDSNLNHTSFTNFGDDVDVFVPGQQIYSSLPNDKMGYLDGTSMASPIVAGSVALIMSYKPDLNAEEIIKLVRASVGNNKVFNLTKIFNS